MSASAHYDAVYDRLNSDTVLNGKGDFSVRVTDAGEAVRTNYWILFDADESELDDERYMASQRVDSRAVYRVDFRAVATSRAGVRLFRDKAKSLLIGHRLVVPGRECTAIVQVPEVEGGRILFDRDTRLWYWDRSFEFASFPA